jgi:tRNA threonylcarbamoyladenosine biosynthesis protein TsaB
MITTLSLDTTSRHTSIAISKDDDIQLEYNFNTSDNLSESLIPSLELVLSNAQPSLNPEDIDLFGIAIGPGLFTGIRVGMATLKGLLLGTKKPVVPVTTLDALAYKVYDSDLPIISIIDAKRKEVYASFYHYVNRELTEIKPPTLISIDKLKEYLGNTASPEDAFHFVGSGVDSYYSFIKENFPQSTAPRRSNFLASEICHIAYLRYSRKEYITDLQKLIPFYIRKSDAETNYERSEGNS